MAVLLSGCAVGGTEVGGGSADVRSLEPRSDLAAKAERWTDAQSTEASAGARSGQRLGQAGSRTRRTGGRGAPAGTVDIVDPAGAAASGGGGSPGRRQSWVSLVRLGDPPDDHGAGPGYADLTGAEISGNRTTLAVAVTVGAAVPARLDAGEVEGIGFDVFRSSSDESDYQVFLDGGTNGWRAFLQGPDGFVDFPGYFGFASRTFHFSVPWKAVGGRRDADVSLFVDWSSGSGATSNDTTARAGLPAP